MTRKDTRYIARDTFKRIFPDAKYHKSAEYDFVLDGKTIKVRGSSNIDGVWKFSIGEHYKADIYAMLAFDNNVDRNLVHMWMIPSDVVGINIRRIHELGMCKWEQYIYEFDEVTDVLHRR